LNIQTQPSYIRLENKKKGDAGGFNDEALAVLQDVYEQSF